MNAAADAVIATESLTKRYGETIAVDRLRLTVWRGEVFGLLGPNGAGKTTTILMLLGLCEPTDGRALVVGVDPTRDPLEVKSRVGYLPDNVGFYDAMTARENLRYTTRLNHLERELAQRRIEEVLAEVGLTERADDRVATFSRGMRQRLGVADALVKHPDVLILDEPTVAVDPRGVEDMLALIHRMAREHGVTVLLASHLLEQVQSVCDRIGIFVRGRLAACGSLAELRSQTQTVIEVEVADGDPGDALSSVSGAAAVDRDGPTWLVRAAGDVRAEVARALTAHGLVPVHLRLREEELGDVYRRYFRGDSGGTDGPPTGP